MRCAQWLFPALAGLAGCFDVSDLTHVDPNVEDAGSNDSGTDAADSASAAGADGGVDASAETSRDGATDAVFDGDAGTDAAMMRTACSQPEQTCGAQEVCAPDGFCLPACDAHGVCIAATSPRAIGSVVVEGEIFYFAIQPTRDTLGNMRGDAEVHRRDPSGARTVVASGQKTVDHLQQQGDFLYWHASSSIWRVLKDGAGQAQKLYDTSCENFLPLDGGQLALLLPEGLFVGSSDGTAELKNISPIAADVAIEYQCPQLAVSGGEIFRLRGASDPLDNKIVATQLVTGVERVVGPPIGGELWNMFAVVAPYIYETYPMGSTMFGVRKEFTDPDLQTLAVFNWPDMTHADSWSLDARLHGDWLYAVSVWGDWSRAVQSELTRWSVVDLGEQQPLVPGGLQVPSDFRVQSDGFAVTDHDLFVIALWYADQQYRGSLLYRVPLP